MREIYSPNLVDQKMYLQNHEAWDTLSGKVAHLQGYSREIFFSSDTAYFLEMLCLNSSFSEQQSADLSRIVRDILLGELFIGDMPKTIVQKLGVQPETARQISSKLINDLFGPAIEDIKKIQREKFPDRVGQGSAAKPDMPQPPVPTQMKGAAPVNQNNIVDLRNRT